MSTISSPRPSMTSIGSPPPPGSRRTSLEIPQTHTSNTNNPRATSRSPAPTQRRNRAALRDYYNLKQQQQQQSPPQPSRNNSIASSSGATATPLVLLQHNGHQDTSLLSSELDDADFDPEAYVQHLLATSGLAAVLKAEGALVSEIKTLDGERKALVYDNYSKLIGAVETIGKMRGSMEEEGEGKMAATRTLGPAVGYIADVAAGLVRERRAEGATGGRKRRNQQETVRWVLDAPKRLAAMVEDGRREEAEADWKEVSALLGEWTGVAGVEEVRIQCEKVMSKESG